MFAVEPRRCWGGRGPASGVGMRLGCLGGGAGDTLSGCGTSTDGRRAFEVGWRLIWSYGGRRVELLSDGQYTTDLDQSGHDLPLRWGLAQ